MIPPLSFYRLTYLLIGFYCISSCKSPQPAKKADSVRLMYSLEQTGCLGNCPVFSLKVFSDRAIHLHARQDLPVTGEFSDTLSASEYSELEEALRSSRFSTWDTLYDAKILDAPFIKIGADQDGVWKLVRCRGQEPPNLDSLLRALEKTMSDRGWLADDKTPAQERAELILHLREENDIKAIEQKYTKYGLQLIKKISPRQPYYLFSTESAMTETNHLINLLKEDKMVVEAQWNHDLRKRNEKN